MKKINTTKLHNYVNQLTIILLIALIIITVYRDYTNTNTTATETTASTETSISYINTDTTEFIQILNNNIPLFSEADKKRTDPFETYSDLDSLKRCGTAYANICVELMPIEPRGDIGSVKPTGWQSIKYDSVDGKYLYNRCHLIGFQLAGENANAKNLITGTRYLNVDGMLPYENMVANYVEQTHNHVLYRVTPIFENNDLVAKYVTMEAYSVEDNGQGICFYIQIANIQPHIIIDYATGNSRQE